MDLYGIKSWAAIATNLFNRSGKQCRERWRNHLRPKPNKRGADPVETERLAKKARRMCEQAEVHCRFGFPPKHGSELDTEADLRCVELRRAGQWQTPANLGAAPPHE